MENGRTKGLLAELRKETSTIPLERFGQAKENEYICCGKRNVVFELYLEKQRVFS